jgi:hypothetical protein
MMDQSAAVSGAQRSRLRACRKDVTSQNQAGRVWEHMAWSTATQTYISTVHPTY